MIHLPAHRARPVSPGKHVSFAQAVITVVCALGLYCQSLGQTTKRSTDPSGAEINLRRTIVVDVTERTKHAVVYISTRKLVAQRFNPFNDPFFDRFDLGQTRVVPGGSLGSGFIIHPDGYIVTNSHVIDRAREIEIELLDGTKHSADLISADPESDLAVLKISTERPLPALELGDSSDLLIGEPVIAVGNPLGFSHTVSTGIVSANHRDLKADDGTPLLKDLIQTDAAINPGNSGGPLLNAYGQVVGINTAIRGDAQNIGFAIQVNRLRDLIPDLMNPSLCNKVDVPLRLREVRTIRPPATVETRVTLADKPTARVASICGVPVSHIVDAYAVLLRVKPNQEVSVTFTPDSGEAARTFAAKAGAPPDAVVQARERLGLVVEELSPLSAERYGLLDEDGMLVTQVLRDSVGARAGIRSGDVIVQLGRYPVTSLKQFANLMQHLPAQGRVRIGVSRGGQRGYGVLEF